MRRRSAPPHPAARSEETEAVGGWRLLTPPPMGARFGASGAIAAIEVSGDVERAAQSLGFAAPPVGRTALRTIAKIDRGLVARPSADSMLLFPHAGPAILAQLFEALDRAGIPRAAPAKVEAAEPLSTQHPALSTVESRMLAALARTSSPLAIDLLLDQPRRWREEPNPEPRALEARTRILNRLLNPPTIVALGAPNIGKSTLLNALAGRQVSLVADLAGTTRDHVGVGLDLAGLAVRWIDTPGMDLGDAMPHAESAEQLALEQARSADLVLLCEDTVGNAQCTMHNAQSADVQSAWGAIIATLSPSAGFIRVRLRADLAAKAPAPPPSLSIDHCPFPIDHCALTIDHCELSIPPSAPPRGLETLVRTIRDRLVPPDVLADLGPWAL